MQPDILLMVTLTMHLSVMVIALVPMCGSIWMQAIIGLILVITQAPTMIVLGSLIIQVLGQMGVLSLISQDNGKSGLGAYE